MLLPCNNLLSPLGRTRRSAAPAGVVSEWCLSCDGVDDWVNCGESQPLVIGEYSVAFWVKTSVISGSRCVISQASSGSPCTFAITIGYSGSGKVNVWNDASGITRNSTASVADGNWHHVAVTRSGSANNWTIVIYIDGTLDSSGTLSQNPYTSGPQVLAIGRFGGYPDYYFNGLIDDVRLWTGTVLGQTEIAALASNTANITTGMTASLALEEGTGTTTEITDGTGSPIDNATINGATWHLQCPPKLIPDRETSVRSLSFDGVDDWVSVPAITLGTVHSASIWIKFNNTANTVVLGNALSNGYLFYFQRYRLYHNSTDGAYVSISHEHSTGAWHNYSVVRNGTSVSFYLDGLQIGDTQILGSNPNNTLAAIGAYPNGSFVLNGFIDDIRIYTTLTVAQIRSLARGQSVAGAVGHWKGDETSGTLVTDYGSGGNNGTCVGGVARSTDVPAWLAP